MRRKLFLILLFSIAPTLFAQNAGSGAPPAQNSGGASHADSNSGEPSRGEGEAHPEKTYFGIPGWILKIANMVLFVGMLIYFVGGPVKKAFSERSEAIRLAADEARQHRQRVDQMAGEIQARLSAIEQEVRTIHERALAEGERQKRELIAAAETEAQKILQTARNEVDNRLKHARKELTEYAGLLASERAESILREKITEQDQRKLFSDSLHAVGEVRS